MGLKSEAARFKTRKINAAIASNVKRLSHQFKRTRFSAHTAVVDTVDEAVLELPHVIALDRHAVRRRFEERFSATRMAADYLAIYRSLLEQSSVSDREKVVPLPRPALEQKLNG
jgi:hypothetical protein